MNKKSIIFCFLFSIFLTGCDGQNSLSKNTQVEIDGQENSAVERIEVFYFHATHRCISCQTIEKYTKETLEEFFQAELQEGKITFQSINVEEAKNKEIVQKYQARGSSLFFNIIKDKKDNISEDTQVWRLVGSEVNFKQYLKGKINNILKK